MTCPNLSCSGGRVGWNKEVRGVASRDTTPQQLKAGGGASRDIIMLPPTLPDVVGK